MTKTVKPGSVTVGDLEEGSFAEFSLEPDPNPAIPFVWLRVKQRIGAQDFEHVVQLQVGGYATTNVRVVETANQLSALVVDTGGNTKYQSP